MLARAHAAVSYIDDATMLHMGHVLGLVRAYVALETRTVRHILAEIITYGTAKNITNKINGQF